jgi:hypothetical protein
MKSCVKMAAAALLAGAITACTTAEWAEIGVALDEANGIYWPDQQNTESLECPSGSGWIVQYFGSQGGQGYNYYHNTSNAEAEVAGLRTRVNAVSLLKKF